MTTNLETMLNYFTQIRRYYANELNKRLKDINLSPNEISILILLSNNHFITTSSQLVVLLGVSKGLISRSIDALVKKECSLLIKANFNCKASCKEHPLPI